MLIKKFRVTVASFPLVISFYTKDTYYQWEVQNLIASCEKFGIEHHIEGIVSFGSWELNCAYKPYYIYQMLQEHQRPVFWVDADAAFIRQPQTLEFVQADIAVRINETLSQEHPSRVMSGSIFVNHTPQANCVLRLWIEECRKQLTDPARTEEFWDQIALNKVLSEDHQATILPLPKIYTKIAGHPQDEIDLQNAVIEHYQASRRLKKLINRSTHQTL